tara:strand:- start:6740 stop:7963 length:1224 start_codon:yes stop_codon:yes gene_type:complete
MGLHMGLENPSHRKSFDPLHDLGAPLIHFDFSKVDHAKFPAKTTGARINDPIASTGAVTANEIRLKSGDFFSTNSFPDAGVVLINSEYFSFSGYDSSGTDISKLLNVTRNVAGTQAAHNAFDDIVLVAGEYQLIVNPVLGTAGEGTGLRDFSNWSTDELQVKNEGSAGGHLIIPTDPQARPAGTASTSLGLLHRRVIKFDGDNDRLDMSSAVVTTDQNFTFLMIIKPLGVISGDAIVSGSSGGINQIKINANTVLVRFNSSGSSNAFAQVRLNDTGTYIVGSKGPVTDKGGATESSLIVGKHELIVVVSEVNSTDNKQKLYVYDAANLVGEKLTSSSGALIDGYPNDGTVDANARLEVDFMGAFSTNASDFQGEVAVVSLYDRALSTAEVALLQEYYDNTYPALRHD